MNKFALAAALLCAVPAYAATPLQSEKIAEMLAVEAEIDAFSLDPATFWASYDAMPPADQIMAQDVLWYEAFTGCLPAIVLLDSEPPPVAPKPPPYVPSYVPPVIQPPASPFVLPYVPPSEPTPTPIPEPTTWAMLLLGFAALAVRFALSVPLMGV